MPCLPRQLQLADRVHADDGPEEIALPAAGRGVRDRGPRGRHGALFLVRAIEPARVAGHHLVERTAQGVPDQRIGMVVQQFRDA